MKQGDYFYPLGMRKKKETRRVLIDYLKLKKKMCGYWNPTKKVVGYRIDDRFKLNQRPPRF